MVLCDHCERVVQFPRRVSTCRVRATDLGPHSCQQALPWWDCLPSLQSDSQLYILCTAKQDTMVHRELKLKFLLASRLSPETEKLGGFAPLILFHSPISQLQTLTRLSSGLRTDYDQMKSPRSAAAPGAATAAIPPRCLLWYSWLC